MLLKAILYILSFNGFFSETERQGLDMWGCLFIVGSHPLD